MGSQYEPGLTRLFHDQLSGTVLDIGANVGFVAVRAARSLAKRGEVIAFEPHPVRFSYLRRNIELNGLTNVRCINCALGSENRQTTLYDIDPTLGPRPLDASRRPGRGRSLRVASRRLDDILRELDIQAVSLVKIDVEGFEFDVLDGMPELLAGKPRLVIGVMEDDAVTRLASRLGVAYALREIDPMSYLAEPLSS